MAPADDRTDLPRPSSEDGAETLRHEDGSLLTRAVRDIPRSLGWRMVLILVCALVGLLGASDWLALGLHRRHLTHMLEGQAVGMSETIISSTHFSMLENDRRHLTQILDNIGRRESVLALRLINANGEVVFSQDSTEVGSTSDMKSRVCLGCHFGGQVHTPVDLRDGIVHYDLPSGEPTLGLGIPVLNEEVCSNASCHYHPPDQAVLGILDLELSTVELEGAVADARRQMIALAIATVVLISAVIGWLAWRVVHQPLHTVLRGITELAAGDRGHRIPNNLPAEAGELAFAFNVMSERLGSAQEALEDWNETLEARIEEKTRELERTRDQMVFTEKMASLGKLAAIVAHEINNPLAGILVYAKLVRRRLPKLVAAELEERETKAKDIDQTLTTIETETGRCGDIVRNLLLFSRQGILAHEATEVNSIVQRAVRLVQHRADLGNVQFDLDLAPNVPELVCDRSEFQQALLALILNALDAMPDGGTLTVRTRYDARDGVPDPFRAADEEEKAPGGARTETSRPNDETAMTHAVRSEPSAGGSGSSRKAIARAEGSGPARTAAESSPSAPARTEATESSPSAPARTEATESSMSAPARTEATESSMSAPARVGAARYPGNPTPPPAATSEGSQIAAVGAPTDTPAIASSGGAIVVEIEDTGIGIPAELRDRIFEPFFSTKVEGAGTGLGLAVTYGIVQRHGGAIDVVSEVGRGTTFVLRFPLTWDRSAGGPSTEASGTGSVWATSTDASTLRPPATRPVEPRSTSVAEATLLAERERT